MQEFNEGYQYAVDFCSRTDMQKPLHLSEELMAIQSQKDYIFIKGFELGIQHQMDKAQMAVLLKRRFNLSYQIDKLEQQIEHDRQQSAIKSIDSINDMLIREKMCLLLKEKSWYSAYHYFQGLTESQKVLFDFALENSLKYRLFAI